MSFTTRQGALTHSRVAIFVGALLLVRCGNSAKPSEGDGGGAGSGGAGGSGGCSEPSERLAPGTLACADGPPALGVLYDSERDCLDTTVTTEVGCVGEASEEGLWCLRRRSDARVYWTRTAAELAFDSEKWEPCSCGAVEEAAPPCFASECERAPASLCALPETKVEFSCGGSESEWDEACCGRKECTDSSGCAADKECRTIPTIARKDCWPSGDSCECAGTLGGPERDFCFPKEPAP